MTTTRRERELVKELLNRYTDSSFQLNEHPDKGDNATGNGQMNRGVAICVMSERNLLTVTDRDGWARLIDDSKSKLKGDGHFNRSKWKTNELNSHDNLIGLLCGSYFIDGGHVAGNIFDVLSANHWRWNNINENGYHENGYLDSRVDRFIWVPILVRMCTKHRGIELPILDKLTMAAVNIWNAVSSNKGAGDGRMQNYAMTRVFKHEYKVIGGLTALLYDIIIKIRFGGNGLSWKSQLDHSHPLIKLADMGKKA